MLKNKVIKTICKTASTFSFTYIVLLYTRPTYVPPPNVRTVPYVVKSKTCSFPQLTTATVSVHRDTKGNEYVGVISVSSHLMSFPILHNMFSLIKHVLVSVIIVTSEMKLNIEYDGKCYN